MKASRIVLVASLALAFAVFNFSKASAQTYKRHALIEEGTGTWCGYCPYGAFTIDSMTSAMGDNLVVISWHGPAGYGEPLWIKAGDTIGSYDSVTGFPWASVGRAEAMSGAYEQAGTLDWPNPWSETAQLDAQQAPVVDFRIVNATYNSGAVDFDIDITPLSTRMPTEDTGKFFTIAVLTEDNIVESQHIYDDPNQDQIDNFTHYNVARALGSRVLGDAFSVKTATTWPIRRHYHINATNSDWVPSNMRIKSFASYKGKQSHFQFYLDAGQTGYITSLPSTAPDMVWTVLPASKQAVSGDSTHVPVVWATGGNVSAVKLEYSADGGNTWNTIVASTGTSPYEWAIPSDAYGQTVNVRVSDASNSGTTFTGPSFTIAQKPKALIFVSSPMSGDSLLVGTTETITFTTSGPVDESSLKLEYSTDSMHTWNTIATVSNASPYNWTVPEAPSEVAAIRITDANGVSGVSQVFAIVDSGKVSNVTIDGAPDLPPGMPETVHWIANGYLGESVDLDYFDPAQGIYKPLSHGLSATATSFDWMTIPPSPESGYIIKVKYASGATGYSQPFSVGAAGVSAPTVPDVPTIVPNPISAAATLSFTLNTSANVTLSVRDLLGREVLHLAEGTLSAGNHTIGIDGLQLTPGTYEYQLTTGSGSMVGKLTVVR